MSQIIIEGPFFEDFKRGDIIESAPSITLTEGHAVAHQQLFGDRLRLPLDHVLCEKVTGSKQVLANPSMVINMAIGQSTYATQNVIGNLFYRGLVLKQPVYLGDTLYTTTSVALLKQNKPKASRPASGLVVLEIRVLNQLDEELLHFWRCPMIPCRDQSVVTGYADDLGSISSDISLASLLDAVPSYWNLKCYRTIFNGLHFNELNVGTSFLIKARDTVTCAPELARLSLNLAMAHTDATKSVYGKRLVYGGHTISMAAAQILRALPNLMTILAWRYCDHLAPVFENDILHTELFIDDKTALPTTGGIVEVRAKVFAERQTDTNLQACSEQVLDWGLVILMA
ncbi:MAG: acyl dehydratase [Cycloclasticus sp.]|nr:MAG: acyl dehydratase [Cycloclasticus sp.]